MGEESRKKESGFRSQEREEFRIREIYYRVWFFFAA
jgi:hypothetical protein